ncbi:hypothetical protein PFISCL1PPCAC_25561, partial [Pristionchus fissidentatus]
MSGEDELPSWDEFGAEQLDYEEDEPVAAPLDDPGDPGDAPSCSSSSASLQPAAAAAATARAAGATGRAAERDIGPSLPPGFELTGGGGEEEDEDPEDPGEPGDPGMQPAVEDEAEMAPTLPSVGGPSLPVDEPAPVAAAPAAAPRR